MLSSVKKKDNRGDILFQRTSLLLASSSSSPYAPLVLACFPRLCGSQSPHASSRRRAAFRSRAIPRPPALPCVVPLVSPLPCSRCRRGRLHHVQAAACSSNDARGNQRSREYSRFTDASRQDPKPGRWVGEMEDCGLEPYTGEIVVQVINLFIV